MVVIQNILHLLTLVTAFITPFRSKTFVHDFRFFIFFFRGFTFILVLNSNVFRNFFLLSHLGHGDQEVDCLDVALAEVAQVVTLDGEGLLEVVEDRKQIFRFSFDPQSMMTQNTMAPSCIIAEMSGLLDFIAEERHQLFHVFFGQAARQKIDLKRIKIEVSMV